MVHAQPTNAPSVPLALFNIIELCNGRPITYRAIRQAKIIRSEGAMLDSLDTSFYLLCRAGLMRRIVTKKKKNKTHEPTPAGLAALEALRLRGPEHPTEGPVAQRPRRPSAPSGDSALADKLRPGKRARLGRLGGYGTLPDMAPPELPDPLPPELFRAAGSTVIKSRKTSLSAQQTRNRLSASATYALSLFRLGLTKRVECFPVDINYSVETTLSKLATIETIPGTSDYRISLFGALVASFLTADDVREPKPRGRSTRIGPGEPAAIKMRAWRAKKKKARERHMKNDVAPMLTRAIEKHGLSDVAATVRFLQGLDTTIQIDDEKLEAVEAAMNAEPADAEPADEEIDAYPEEDFVPLHEGDAR